MYKMTILFCLSSLLLFGCGVTKQASSKNNEIINSQISSDAKSIIDIMHDYMSKKANEELTKDQVYHIESFLSSNRAKKDLTSDEKLFVEYIGSMYINIRSYNTYNKTNDNIRRDNAIKDFADNEQHALKYLK